jgi:cardiolipin synthase A/B
VAARTSASRARRVTINILWGKDDEHIKASASGHAATALQGAARKAGGGDQVIVHRSTTGSHAKLLIADDGDERWSAIGSSCNWLLTGFDNFWMSIRIRDPWFVAKLIQHVASPARGAPVVEQPRELI